MLPNKSHLQLIVKELEKFEANLEASYNFQEFFDRCRAIFTPEIQEELDVLFYRFEKVNLVDSLTAQNILFQARVRGIGGKRVLKITDEDGAVEKVPLSLNKLEIGLRMIVVWCRKQIINMIRDEQVDFSKMDKLDLEGVNL